MKPEFAAPSAASAASAPPPAPDAELSTSVLSFARQSDVDLFVDTLAKFERGEITADAWRAFRLVNGAYGQRQEADWSMLRAKLPQGVLGADALRAIADVADRHSRGFFHVTTRQNVQLHFLKLAEMGQAMTTLAGAGITTREACGNSVRNVTCDPFAGVDADEAYDPRPYAEALTRFFLRHPLAATLPRKFKIAFNGGAADSAFAAVNDLGFNARVRARADGTLERGFLLTVAGGTATFVQSGRVLYEFLPAARIFDVAEAVLRVFDREGDRVHRHKNRMKFLVKQLGWDTFRERVAASLADVEADGGRPLPFPADDPGVVEAVPTAYAATPTVAELVALAAGAQTTGAGLHPRALPIAGGEDALATFVRTNVRSQKQAGRVAVLVTLPLGDLTSGQGRALARVAEAFSDGTFRATPNQNLVLRHVEEGRVAELHRLLVALGLGSPRAGTVADVASCPGAESCKLAVTQSRGLGRLVSEHFAERPALADQAGAARVHVSGCPNGCGLHHVAPLGFQGGLRKIGGRPAPYYFVYVGGGVADHVARFGKVAVKIPARRAPAVVERLLALHAAERETPEETFEAFLQRVPHARFKAALADLEALDEADARPEDFVDLGETEAFRPETSEGECAA